MAVIHVLDQHTAELIAAGEVVERPASVVKELLENAIDAQAKQITVTIEKGGVSLIRVADNGDGIEAEYIPTAFIRHATSKIQSEQDLETIHTLGFRGEALASIASVSRVEVLTKTEPDEFACCYRIEGGQEIGIEPGARPIGTTITVRDLFYNTPARMKFLKKDSSEGTYVGETVTRIALSHPEVSVSFIREGKMLYKTPGNGDLKSAIYAVLGREFAKDLIEVDSKNGTYKVWGLITPPRACRASRGMQFFFINGRFVKNRTMMAALENAYRGTLMQGKFPGGVLMLEMPPQLVDVNVHPAKTEVRFARENDVFDAVYSAAKNALGAPGSAEQQFTFCANEKQEPFLKKQELPPLSIPVKQPIFTGMDELKRSETPTLESIQKADWNPDVMVSYQSTSRNESQPNLLNSESLPLLVHRQSDYDKSKSSKNESAEASVYPEKRKELEQTVLQDRDKTVPLKENEAQQFEQVIMESEPKETALQYIGEVFKTYIITQREQELCLIDKHAAHERILYERLVKTYGQVSSQMLLAPVVVNLSAEEKNALLENEKLLSDAGVEAEDFGGNTMLVRAVPADVEIVDAEALLCELAAKLAKGTKDAMNEKTEWVLHSIACRAAIKAGDHTTSRELLELAQDILSGKVPPFCPHGRPVILKLTKKELEKQFGRIV